jgi:hypothetical protein
MALRAMSEPTERPTPRWTVGPLLAWLAVLLSSLVALALLAYVWTTGSAPWPTSSSSVPYFSDLSLELALVIPAVLVLLGTFVASRVHQLKAPAAPDWTASGQAAPEPGH